MIEKFNQPIDTLENDINASLKGFAEEEKKLKDRINRPRKDKEKEQTPYTLTPEEKEEILKKLEKDNPLFKEKMETYNETSTLVDLSEIEITDEQLEYTRPLIQTFSSLTQLELNNNNLTYIDYIQNLPNMTNLDLRGNQILPLENSEIFSGCMSLEYLNLSENHIIDLDTANLKNIRSTLKVLEINSNTDEEYADIKLSRIAGLENLESLEILEARGNNIAESRWFANMGELKELYLDGNLLVNLNDMKNLPNLEIIEISNNNFWNIKLIKSGGKNFKKPTIVNKGASIAGLKKIPSLEEVILDKEVVDNKTYFEYVEGGNRLSLQFGKNEYSKGKKGIKFTPHE